MTKKPERSVCSQCGATYEFLDIHELFAPDASFAYVYGNISPSPAQCRSCFKKDSSKKYAWKRKETKDVPEFESVTLSDILRWEKSQKYIKQTTPLIDIDDPENKNFARIVKATDGKFKGREFIVSTWSKTSNHSIAVVVFEVLGESEVPA